MLGHLAGFGEAYIRVRDELSRRPPEDVEFHEWTIQCKDNIQQFTVHATLALLKNTGQLVHEYVAECGL